MWMANQKYAKRKKIAEALGPQLHCSKKRLIKDVIPYLQIMYKKNDYNLKLDDELVEWLQTK